MRREWLAFSDAAPRHWSSRGRRLISRVGVGDAPSRACRPPRPFVPTMRWGLPHWSGMGSGVVFDRSTGQTGADPSLDGATRLQRGPVDATEPPAQLRPNGGRFAPLFPYFAHPKQ
jgi:hypothetical protein